MNEHTHEHNHEHSHEHTHEHTHEHSHEHTHEHTHEHSHEHSHEHVHHHGTDEAATSREELLALLSYMVSHNKHHCEEIAELAKSTEGDAALALQNAIHSFEEGNQLLELALETLKKHQ